MRFGRRRWFLPWVLGALLGVGFAVARPRSAVESLPTSPARAASTNAEVPPLPETLEGTGLYSDFEARTIARANRPFTPQYPLWTDGARKRRWISLPPGTSIDAANPDAWGFPVGTKLWKELSFGRPVETRFIERTPAGWRFAAYVWSDDGRRATLAPERGAAVASIAPGVAHRIPSRGDCRVCHESGPSPVLGFSALQLSTDRDPNALHAEPLPLGALDLGSLASEGLVRGLAGGTSPRIAARTPTERAALGYLHSNCGTCHRGDGELGALGMVLLSSPSGSSADAPLQTTVDRPSRSRPGAVRVARRSPDRSLLLERMRSRMPLVQMPPLGTQLVDEEGVRLLSAWIEELPDG